MPKTGTEAKSRKRAQYDVSSYTREKQPMRTLATRPAASGQVRAAGRSGRMTDWPIVVLTGALVLVTGYYAWQNKRMVDEMRKQNRPYVFIVWHQDRLLVRNAGTRSAHRIRVHVSRDARLSEGEIERSPAGDDVLTLKRVGAHDICTKGIDTLVPNAERDIGPAHAHPRTLGTQGQHQRLEYTVEYSDGAGTRYAETLTEEYTI